MEDFLDINIFGDSNDSPLLTQQLELFFQEIALGIKVAPGEIWGCYAAIDLQKYLFNQYITINTIKNEVQLFISKNCSHASIFQYETNAQILTVNDSELIYIEVKVYTEDGNEFLQKFVLGQ